MAVMGLALCLLTLPFVGWQTWLDWLTVGRAASRHYMTDEPWIFLSRDLQGIPRRYLLNFDADGRATNPDRPLPTLIGQVLWLTILGLTVVVALWRWRRPAGTDGPAAAFLMLGAWLGCFHFMYYDALLALLPVCLLLTEPPRWWLRRPIPLALLALLLGLPHLADGIDYLRTGGHPTYHSPPFDTFCLLGCGRGPAGVGGAPLTSPTRQRGARFNPSLAFRAGKGACQCALSKGRRSTSRVASGRHRKRTGWSPPRPRLTCSTVGGSSNTPQS